MGWSKAGWLDEQLRRSAPMTGGPDRLERVFADHRFDPPGTATNPAGLIDALSGSRRMCRSMPSTCCSAPATDGHCGIGVPQAVYLGPPRRRAPVPLAKQAKILPTSTHRERSSVVFAAKTTLN